jgi:hypothetical protein
VPSPRSLEFDEGGLAGFSHFSSEVFLRRRKQKVRTTPLRLTKKNVGKKKEGKEILQR